MNGCNEILECHESVATVSENIAADTDHSPVRIWLVDDNDGFRSLLASILEDEPGFKCARQFPSPDAVLKALARETPPDVVLLDIEMGEHNGLDAIRPIKALAKGSHVLMLTTFAGPGGRERAFREGASDFMLKTWPTEEIIAHIHQAMEFGSVAGLLTAFLGKGTASESESAMEVELPERLSWAERLMIHLRGLRKLSPS